MGSCLSVRPVRGKCTEVRIEKSTLEAAFVELDTVYFKPLGARISEFDDIQDALVKLKNSKPPSETPITLWEECPHS